ncbi:MAG: S-methyl-5'-thioadenosine phosphorylase [Nitrospiria bacterium]
MKRTARKTTPRAAIGIIGGSGLYDMDGLTARRTLAVRTPFGAPSGPLSLGSLGGMDVAFLARHGAGHRLSPSEINYRANIHALKQVGVERILSVSAVGSMKESIHPGDLVLPDQFYDHTKQRRSTFFEGGIVAHAAFGDPVCPELTAVLASACDRLGVTAHRGGTYLCMEGPQFSSRGESLVYRQWGVDVIGMTNATEAKLAREAEICYATLALVTDYDCWHRDEAPVTVEAVIKLLAENVAKAKRVLGDTIPALKAARRCACGDALRHAVITAPAAVPARTRTRLKLLLARWNR